MARNFIRSADWTFTSVAHRAEVFAMYEMKQVAPGYYAGTAYGDNGEVMAVVTRAVTAFSLTARFNFYQK